MKKKVNIPNKLNTGHKTNSAWEIIAKANVELLRRLKEEALIKSVGASTRIEGSKLTDAEVKDIIEFHKHINKNRR